jgi:putative transposase
MARARHSPEEIVAKLRQVEALRSKGKTCAEAVRSIGVSEGVNDHRNGTPDLHGIGGLTHF